MKGKLKDTLGARASEWKRKKAILESATVYSQRIGITLKLETVRKLCQFKVKIEFYGCTLFSENEIIHILMYMYFTETRQLGLEQEYRQNTSMQPRKDKLQARSTQTNYL